MSNNDFKTCRIFLLCAYETFFFSIKGVSEKKNSGKIYNIQFLLGFHTFISFTAFIRYLFALQVAKSCFVPALLGHAIEDDFIRPHHSDRIFEAYMVNMFCKNLA